MKKGFTLIELLVVIAIIGILSGIVLTSLNTARTKAKAARITAVVAQMRTMMEANADSAGVYSTVSGNDYTAMNNDVAAQGGTMTQIIKTGGGGYCVYATYSGTTGKNWCVDSVGNSKEYAAIPATCVAATATCQP